MFIHEKWRKKVTRILILRFMYFFCNENEECDVAE
jgi:hypothetical protein